MQYTLFNIIDIAQNSDSGKSKDCFVDCRLKFGDGNVFETNPNKLCICK